MPTHDRLSLTAALPWLRVQVDRLRRSVMARRPVVRWGLVLGALIGLTSVIYWAGTSLTTLSVRYLVSGRRFSSEDLIEVCRTLDRQRVAYRVDDLRRVEVSTDQYEQAADAVAKLDLGPRSLNEIREESILSNFFDTPADRERRKQLFREKTIERLIGQLDGVVWSLVAVNRPQARKWQHPTAKATAFVYIETEGKLRLPYNTVQSIPTILAGLEEDLTPALITVMDTRGYKYLESGNLAVGVDSRNRAREEELVGKILQELEWVKGVRVQVKVPAARTVEPLAASATAGNASRSPGGVLAPQPGGPGAAIFLNQAADLTDPDSLPRLPADKSAVATNSREPTQPGGPPGDLDRQPRPEPGQILISVPRSFYLSRGIRADNREPNRDELRVMADRTEEQIRKEVNLITPSSETWKVDIFTFPDAESLSPLVVQSPVDARRKVLDWGIVGTVVAALSIVAAAGSWIKAARSTGGTSRNLDHKPALPCRRGIGTGTFGTGARAGPA